MVEGAHLVEVNVGALDPVMGCFGFRIVLIVSNHVHTLSTLPCPFATVMFPLFSMFSLTLFGVFPNLCSIIFSICQSFVALSQKQFTLSISSGPSFTVTHAFLIFSNPLPTFQSFEFFFLPPFPIPFRILFFCCCGCVAGGGKAATRL